MRMMRPLFVFVLATLALSGCGAAGGGGGSQFVSWTVRATAGPGGSISPATQTVVDGDGATLSLTPDSGYSVESVTGCGGTFDSTTNTYNISRVPSTCLVTATFTPDSYTATATAGPNGSITPDTATLEHGARATFTITPAPGYGIAGVSGCGGTLAGDTYTTGEVTADCKVEATFATGYAVGGTLTLAREGVDIVLQTSGGDELTLNANGPFEFPLPIVDGRDYAVTITKQPGGQKCVVTNGTGKVNGAPVTTVDVSGCEFVPPAAPEVSLAYDVKELKFSWNEVEGASYYRAFENPDGNSGYSQIGELQVGVDPVTTEFKHEISLPRRVNARYQIEACSSPDPSDCRASSELVLADRLIPAIGYFKASNTGVEDYFGYSIALSKDGNTLAVGAPSEDSATMGDQSDDSADSAGAVYIFTQSDSGWSQQAYLKGSLTGAKDLFGYSLALSETGDTLAVGAYSEDSDGAIDGGAAYVFTRTGIQWGQTAHLVPAGISASDRFGSAVSLSADGCTLAVGAPKEDGGVTTDLDQSGAVYVYTRADASATDWSQPEYLKASNIGAGDYFGWSVDLSGDGKTLAVGAVYEKSAATGVGGNEADDTTNDAGAVYVFSSGATGWVQQAYIKASNTGEGDIFGSSVALDYTGDTLAVGAPQEDSITNTINASGTDDDALESGAAYVFARSGTDWAQQAYIKASNSGAEDRFGYSVALSGDGNTLLVGAAREDAIDGGVGANPNDDSATSAGAAYVFTRSSVSQWSQLAYLKASNTEEGDKFGGGSVPVYGGAEFSSNRSVALSSDGNTLAIAAPREDSAATGIDGDETDESGIESGAVYLY